MFALHLRVALTVNVVISMVTQFVLVCLDLLDLHRAVGLNALLIQNVLLIKLVLINIVEILASEHVELEPNALS